MERIVARVDLDAIRQNMISLKNNLKDKTMVMAVVKADGYGLGAVPVAKAVEDLVWGFAVATIDEAVSLRLHRIDKPVLVLGYVPEESFPEMIEGKIRCAAFSRESMEKLSEEAVRQGREAIVHLKVDTGMGRIGFKPSEALDFARFCSELPGIRVEGIFTHLATADMVDNSGALRQRQVFAEVTERLKEEGLLPEIVHCGNSAATIWMPDTPGNLFREGISLYGYYPSDEPLEHLVRLTPGLSLYSLVSFVKTVEKGTPIGYGASFIAPRKMKVATIPVGYADGFPRGLSNRGYVLIKGVKCPIIGRVCMDQIMVDADNVPDVSCRDEVVLIGKSGDAEITLEDICSWSGGFHYELLCLLGRRVPRVYIRQGKVAGLKDYFHDEYEEI